MEKSKITYERPDGRLVQFSVPYQFALCTARAIARQQHDPVMVETKYPTGISTAQVEPDGSGYVDYPDNKALTGLVRLQFDSKISICL